MEMVVSRITTAKRALLPDVYIYVNIEFCVRHGINLKKINKNRNIRFSQQDIFSFKFMHIINGILVSLQSPAKAKLQKNLGSSLTKRRSPSRSPDVSISQRSLMILKKAK